MKAGVEEANAGRIVCLMLSHLRTRIEPAQFCVSLAISAKRLRNALTMMCLGCVGGWCQRHNEAGNALSCLLVVSAS